MVEPNLDIRKWLKDTGWLWHESSVITPECMDDLQAYIAQQVKEAKINELEGVKKALFIEGAIDRRLATLKGDDK